MSELSEAIDRLEAAVKIAIVGTWVATALVVVVVALAVAGVAK